jgi:hypothetical protein
VKIPRSVTTLIISACLTMLIGCGGSSGSSGGGGSGRFSISSLAPSSVMTGIPLGAVTVFGNGFTSQSQVLVDGQPVTQTIQLDSGTLEANVDTSLFTTAGIHQFSVQDGGSVSNSLPFTAYAPQLGPQVMQAIPGFLVGKYEADPTFIVAADLNNDGLSDGIVTGPPLANSNTSIAILYGQPNGSLSAPQYLASSAYALAVGDVDGNGNQDLVSIQMGFSSVVTVNVFLGDGHGNFQQSSAQQVFPGIYPASAYLADVDGDGQPDLLLAYDDVANSVEYVAWLKNNSGNFAPPVTLALAPANTSFQIADLNLDGRPDILYTGQGSTFSFHILMNQGNGNFQDQLVRGLNGIYGLANVLDFNLDGNPDLVIQATQSPIPFYSFRGNGDGSFTQVASTTIGTPGSQLYHFVVGDFDHDGFPDLAGVNGGVFPSHMLYLFGDGRGNFTPQTVVGPQGDSAATGDFDGDGLPDVVVPDRFNFVSLALGRNDRNFPLALSLTPAVSTNLAAGDIDGDGLPEIFIGGFSYSPGFPGTVFQNLGNNSFQLAAYTDPASFTVADLTGKGVVDLIGDLSGTMYIWPNNGTMNFSSSPITLGPIGVIKLADMDRDGHLDFVSDTGQVFYGDGAYNFAPVTVQNLGGQFVIGDFNGDGLLDIKTGAWTFLNAGGRRFNAIADNNVPLASGVLAVVGDFNSDGKDDVAASLPGDPTIAIWYSRGDGTFYEGTLVDPGQYPGWLEVADFDGDGRADIVAGLMLSQQACMLLNSGNGQFTRSFFASGVNSDGVLAVDLNRDGKPDLIFGNVGLSPGNDVVIFHK